MNDSFWVCKVEYEGRDPKFDSKLESLIGRYDASGYNIPDNQKDLSWYFNTKAEAVKAQKTIKHVIKSKVYRVD